MKLYLSSFLLGDNPQRLVELAGSNKKISLILNALDNKSEAREKYLTSQTEGLSALGFEVTELDLRDYFNKREALKQFLVDQGAVWVNGGNTFVLRRAMKYSGFDKIISERILDNTIVYGGFSAGVVLLYKDLHGLDIIDDPNEISEGYDKEIVWEGLDLINFAIAVHYDSDHPESDMMDQEIEFYKTNSIPYKTLRDGEVIIINGGSFEKVI